MNLYLRLLRVALGALVGPRCGILDTSIIRMRCWPPDVEVSRVNNGRYVTMMDLGRVDLTVRVGLLQVCRKRRWWPVIAGLTIRYRRAIALWEAFELHTRVVFWDERFFYIEQKFVKDGEVAVIALVRSAVRGKGATVPPAEVLRAGGLGVESPPCPEPLEQWLRADAALARAA